MKRPPVDRMKPIKAYDLLAAVQKAESLELVRGEGAQLWDSAGKRYLNLNEMSVCLGEGNATFEAYIKDSLAKPGTMHGLDSEYKAALLDYMMTTTNHRFHKVLLTASGSEATEWAVKVAKKMTGRTETICFWNSIHGRTHYSAGMSGLPKRKARYGPIPGGNIFVPFPACNRCPFLQQPERCNFHCLRFLEQHVEYASGHDIAALIIEPCQGVDNTFPPPGYLKALRQWTLERGILLLFDEVQSGMGRTGDMYRYQVEDAEPDILILGKALGNGLHIAAFLMKGDLPDEDICALSGGTGDEIHACAAACAVYEELTQHGMLQHIRTVGAHFKKKLLELQAQHPSISAIRGEGLALAMELSGAEEASRVASNLWEQGILVGKVSAALVFKPPYSLTEQQADEAIGAISSALQANL